MIWGVTLYPGVDYTEIISDEVRLSMAALECRSRKADDVPTPASHVVLTTVKGEFVLCSLEKGPIPQQNLDLVLQPREKVTFTVEGTGIVHLTGYTPECPTDVIDVDSPEAISQSQSEIDDLSIELQEDDDFVVKDEVSESFYEENLMQSRSFRQSSPGETSSHGEEQFKSSDRHVITDDTNEGWIPEEADSPEMRSTAGSVVINQGLLVPQHQLLSSSGSPSDVMVDKAKSVFKKLKQMRYRCCYCFKEFSSQVVCKQHEQIHERDGNQRRQGILYSELRKRGSMFKRAISNFTEKTVTAEGRGPETPSQQNSRERNPSDRGEYPYKCKFCGKSFAQQNSFSAHSRLHEVENAARMHRFQSTASARPLTISNSSTRIDQEESMTIHTSNPSDPSVQENLHSSSGRMNACRFCRKLFSSNSKRIIHERKHTGEKPYKCKHCSRGFAAMGDCRRHEQLHTEEGMLNLPRCRFCSKPFYSSSKCLIHERIHTGEKPFECRLCGKAFSQKGHLKTHERIHTGERPFQCQFCDRGFSTGSGRKKHERLHLGKRPLKLK